MHIFVVRSRLKATRLKSTGKSNSRSRVLKSVSLSQSSQSACSVNDCNIVLAAYEVEHLLSTMKASSPGLDNIPHCFYHTCSYEIAEVVTHVLNCLFLLELYLSSGRKLL